MNPLLASQLNNLPTEPGIYKYFDVENELIYVGKAVNLRNRVKSYFSGQNHSPKTKILVSRIERLETIVVRSEVDALILEANLIKQFLPRYNIILKDDKSHLYIKITEYEDLPRVSACRQTDLHLDSKAAYFGPFPSGMVVKQTLRQLRKVFPYVARHQPPIAGRRRPPQSYFYYNLPLGQVDAEINKKLYRLQIRQLIRFLEGGRLQVAEELEREMKSASKALEFERAAELKRQLDNLAYLSQQVIRPESYVANPELMIDKRNDSLRQLATEVSTYFPAPFALTSDSLSEELLPLQRIECYDISNISGQQAVGSMVVFIFGQAQKNHYRKFRIKREQAPNDVAMIQEVLKRRFKRLTKAGEASEDESFASVPDLIIIDGGKGQLTAIRDVLRELGLNIPIAGMTKREEELVVLKSAISVEQVGKATTDAQSTEATSHPTKANRSGAHAAIARNEEEAQTQVKEEAEFVTIRLARGSEALFLLQRLRDEAHRFAISYHRKLRSKDFLPNK